MIIDEYKTLVAPTEGEYKEKGSKFIAYAFPVKTEEEIANHLQEVKNQHFKARHFCYAYQLGVTGDIFRYNDDGEPSGSAGKPIFGQIQSFELTDMFIVVVRYFGGTKLGVSGLITAYKEAAKEALNKGEIVQNFICSLYLLVFEYSKMGEVMDTLKSLDFNIVDKEFTDKGRVTIEIRKSQEKEELVRLKSTLLNVSPEYIEDDTEVDYCAINIVEIDD